MEVPKQPLEAVDITQAGLEAGLDQILSRCHPGMDTAKVERYMVRLGSNVVGRYAVLVAQQSVPGAPPVDYSCVVGRRLLGSDGPKLWQHSLGIEDARLSDQQLDLVSWATKQLQSGVS